MIQYKAQFERRDKDAGSGYIAHYGRAKKKLNAIVMKGAKGWYFQKGDGPARLRSSVPKLADFKEDWAAWAEQEWQRRWGPPRIPGPPQRRRQPPHHVPGPRVAEPMKPVPKGELPPTLEYEFASDPFAPKHKYGHDQQDVYKRKQLTPLGVILEVHAWLHKHRDIFDDIPEIAPLKQTIKECLHREDPVEYKKLQIQWSKIL